MQTLKSDYRPLGNVQLPEFKGRQKYMHSFDLSGPAMSEGFEDYENPVRQLCIAAGAFTGIAHMTVDEKIIEAGMSQRRPGPHVDGCFIPAHNSWGHKEGSWNHYCNHLQGERISRMAIIVAATVAGCLAWRGIFHGEPQNDGDLSHLKLGTGELLPANMGYLLSPDCIHESIRFTVATKRTFLRIALPLSFCF